MNKKAVSIIVAYTILIVVAIGISAIVYSSLKLYLPSDKETCPEQISIRIEEANCSGGNLTVLLSNTGLFNISAVYIRFQNSSRIVRNQLNPNEGILIVPPQSPNQVWEMGPYDISNITTSSGQYTVEVQPAVIVKQKVALCVNAVVTEDVFCAV